MNGFTGIEQRLKVHVAYAHTFGDALTEADLIAYCDPSDPVEVKRSLQALESEGLIERRDGYCFLAGHAIEGHSATVAARRKHSEELLDRNRLLLRFVGRLPWVRLVAISGSLAHDNPRPVRGKRTDVDLFIITEPGSVHLVRLIARAATNLQALFAYAKLSRPPAHLCLNYMTEGNFLEVTNKSLFTASDALHVRVLHDPAEHARFLAANVWIGRYYPIDTQAANAAAEVSEATALRSISNLACFFAMATAQWLKGRFIGRKFLYSLRERHDRPIWLRRVGPEGGGFQPQIAERFRLIYRRHFGADEGLETFLFPDTTDTGVYLDGRHYESRHPSLAFDE